MSDTQPTEVEKEPQRRPSYWGLAGMLVGAVSLAIAVLPMTLTEAEEIDRATSKDPRRTPETRPALSEVTADFLIDTGEHVAVKLGDRLRQRFRGEDGEQHITESETQPADDGESPDGTQSVPVAVSQQRTPPRPEEPEDPPASRRMSRLGTAHIAAAGGGLLAVLLAAVSWVRHEDHRVSIAAAVLGVAALTWKYVVVGIVIAVVLFVLALIGGALG